MERGYVKLWRKSFDSAVFADPTLWKLWCLCLMRANHKPHFVAVDGIAEPIEIQHGEFITGRFALHKEFYPRKKKNQKSPSTLWNLLKTLQNMRNLNIRSHAKYSIISICNWNDYQQNEQQANNRLTTDEQQTNTDKNVKNEKNDKNNPPIVPPTKNPKLKIPEWIDQTLWADFLKMRKSIKKPVTTETANTRLINALKKITDSGYDQKEVIGLAIEKNWQSFYAPKYSPTMPCEIIDDPRPQKRFEDLLT